MSNDPEHRNRGRGFDLWSNCMLEGEALEAELFRVLDVLALDELGLWRLIESNQVFLDAPSEQHLNFGGKRPNETVFVDEWRATVSARVRTYPNRSRPAIGNVGRGRGPTPLISVMRAIVASFGPSEAEREKDAAARAKAPERDIEF